MAAVAHHLVPWLIIWHCCCCCWKFKLYVITKMFCWVLLKLW